MLQWLLKQIGSSYETGLSIVAPKAIMWLHMVGLTWLGEDTFMRWLRALQCNSIKLRASKTVRPATLFTRTRPPLYETCDHSNRLIDLSNI